MAVRVRVVWPAIPEVRDPWLGFQKCPSPPVDVIHSFVESAFQRVCDSLQDKYP